jgi:glycosyltransferase involved in cell wall biosynthesis
MKNKAIRILHLVDWLGLAGMEYGIIKLVNRLPYERFEPIICCLIGKQAGVDEILEPHVKTVVLGKQRGIDLKILWKVAQLTKMYNIDILHSHNWATYPYAAVARFINNNLRWVHGEHGRETQKYLLSKKQKYFIAFTKRHIERITSVAAHLADDLVHTWKVDRNRVFVIPNGIDLDTFNIKESQTVIRQSLGLDISNLVIGTVGGFRLVKDHKTLFAAVGCVARQQDNIIQFDQSCLTDNPA